MRTPSFVFLGAIALCTGANAQNVGSNYCGPAASNSSGAPATISGTGSDVAGGNPLTLTASSLPTSQFGYFLVSQNQGFFANPGGSQGNLCLAGPIGRYTASIGNSGSTGVIALAIDTNSIPVNPSVAVQAGETWNFQLWFRDVNPMATSNFTDGLSITFTGGSGLDADFDSNVVSGTSDLSVSFNDLSTGGATSWDWDFGDGNSSSMQNPIHIYTARGTYDVSLTVGDGSGMDVELKSSYINVLQGFTAVWNDFNLPAFDFQGNPTGDRCTDCHGANGFAGFDLPNEGAAYAAMVGVASTCNSSLTRVIPGDALNSLVYNKIAGNPACGSSMPLAQVYSGDLQVLENWILDGAQQ
ncbi:MAG: PKD repeat protein [Planctomycetota bacterium]|jgi:PKD repeat protein